MGEVALRMNGFHTELEKIAITIPRGVVGAVGSAARKAVSSTGSTARDVGGLLSRFGKRQVHGVTGWTPKAGIQSIRGGAYETGKRMEAAKGAVSIKAPGATQGRMDKLLRRTPEKIQQRAAKSGHKEMVAARKGDVAGRKAEEMGLTSLPGYAKSLKNNGVGKTIRAGMGEQWHSVGPVGKSMMVLPAIPVASELARESKPGEAGRFAREGAGLGEFASTMGPVPIAGQIAAGTALGALGKRVGALADRKKNTKHVPAPATLEPAGGEAVAGEPVISDRAMGDVQ